MHYTFLGDDCESGVYCTMQDELIDITQDEFATVDGSVW